MGDARRTPVSSNVSRMAVIAKDVSRPVSKFPPGKTCIPANERVRVLRWTSKTSLHSLTRIRLADGIRLSDATVDMAQNFGVKPAVDMTDCGLMDGTQTRSRELPVILERRNKGNSIVYVGTRYIRNRGTPKLRQPAQPLDSHT